MKILFSSLNLQNCKNERNSHSNSILSGKKSIKEMCRIEKFNVKRSYETRLDRKVKSNFSNVLRILGTFISSRVVAIINHLLFSHLSIQSQIVMNLMVRIPPQKCEKKIILTMFDESVFSENVK